MVRSGERPAHGLLKGGGLPADVERSLGEVGVFVVWGGACRGGQGEQCGSGKKGFEAHAREECKAYSLHDQTYAPYAHSQVSPVKPGALIIPLASPRALAACAHEPRLRVDQGLSPSPPELSGAVMPPCRRDG